MNVSFSSLASSKDAVPVGRGGRRRRRGGRAREERRLFAVEQLGAEARHLVLHFAHLGVEALADRVELGVEHGEIAQLDGDDVLSVGHFVNGFLATRLLLVHSDKEKGGGRG